MKNRCAVGFLPVFALCTFSVITTRCEAKPLRLAYQDIVTFSVAGSTQPAACDSALFLAKNGCLQQKLFNITKVSCDCKQTAADKFECVATVICQDK
jgi:hypothetical protein